MLLSLSGIDCAGKTTQLELLEGALEREGHRVSRLWFRPGYSGLLDRLRAILRWFRPRALPTADRPEARAVAFGRPGVARLWAVMALLDTAIQYGVKVRVLRLMRRVVLCDRYLDDGLLDLDLRFPTLEVPNWWLTRLVRWVTPTPDLALMLMLSHEEMRHRMVLKDEPFPDPEDIRDIRFRAYQAMADRDDIAVIDASGSIGLVHQAILATVEEGRS